jgi:uncharacterized membrane protein YcaP (DUF421 family)
VSEELIASMSLNKVLIAILEEHGTISVPTLRFIDAGNTEKELVVDYDDEGPSFKFSLRDKNESS